MFIPVINLHSQLYYFTDCFNRLLGCSIIIIIMILFCKLSGRAQQVFWKTWALSCMPLIMPLRENYVTHVSHILTTLVSNFMLVYGL